MITVVTSKDGSRHISIVATKDGIAEDFCHDGTKHRKLDVGRHNNLVGLLLRFSDIYDEVGDDVAALFTLIYNEGLKDGKKACNECSISTTTLLKAKPVGSPVVFGEVRNNPGVYTLKNTLKDQETVVVMKNGDIVHVCAGSVQCELFGNTLIWRTRMNTPDKIVQV